MIGIGYDVHRLSKGIPLIIGGTRLDISIVPFFRY